MEHYRLVVVLWNTPPVLVSLEHTTSVSVHGTLSSVVVFHGTLTLVVVSWNTPPVLVSLEHIVSGSVMEHTTSVSVTGTHHQC